MAHRVNALILAGGAGTRFWPASRAKKPKQLLPLTGGEPLLRETALRVLPIVGGWSGVFVATGAHLEAATRALLPELDAKSFFVEPVARNTAPCIAWAAAAIAKDDPEAIVVVLPSDHHVDAERFQAAVRHAVATASSGVVTTIGVTPTHAETGFGYIEVGDAIDAHARSGARFVEKPSRDKAEEYVKSGKYLWNAGMFFFRAKDMVDAFRAHLPGMNALLDAALAGADVATVFPEAPSISVDHGVMEKLARFAVVPGDFGWSDIGSFASAHDLAKKDAEGNHGPASAVFVDAKNNHVVDLRSGGAKRVVAIVGASDLVVVETDDALLVVPRERSQDVRLVVERLKARGDGDLT